VQLAFVIGGVVSPAVTQFFLTSKHYLHRAPGNETAMFHNQSSPDYSQGVVFSTTQGVTSTAPQLHTTIGSHSQTYNDSTITAVAVAAAGLSADSLSDEHRLVQLKANVTNISSVNQSSKTGQYVVFREAFLEDQRVVYAYAIAAAVTFAAALPFLAGRIFRKQSESTLQETEVKAREGRRHRDTTKKMLPVLVAVGVLFFGASGVEETFHQFLAAFLVRDQHWVPTAAALVTSWFWCGALLVRLASLLMPSSVWGEDQGVTLTLSCSLLPASLVALHVAALYANKDGVWASVFFSGMSSTLVFPTAFTWLHTAFPLVSPGALAATVMLCTALAGVINPLVLGSFLQRRLAGSRNGQGAFCFLLLTEACLALLALIVLRVMTNRAGPFPASLALRRKHRSNIGDESSEDDDDDDEIVMEIEVPSPGFQHVHEPTNTEK
jgi:hypothetical protein